jgi:hypothetical protein
MAVLTVIAAGGALLARRRENWSVGVLAFYIVGLSIWFFRCGRNDASRLGAYSRLIAANRALGPTAAFSATKVGLLLEESNYLTKIGRPREAEVTNREIQKILAAEREKTGSQDMR